jgi:branched-chain amino acid transport system ATP-binding protein
MTEHILQVTDLSVRFGGIKALEHVSFKVKPHTITAIIGPNGAGKTTVFNCLTGFYKPHGGRLLYADGNTKTHDLAVLLGQKLRFSDFVNPTGLGTKLYYKMFGGTHKIAALGVARTFQNIRLFKDMTAIENLLVAQHRKVNRNLLSGLFSMPGYRSAEKQAVAKAYEWLERMDLMADANRLAKELPYGHQRRLEIARAMCTDAKLLCLDEPAAGLNHQETLELSNLISDLRKDFGVTVLVIEHDMALVMKISDHIIVLDHGCVIAKGTPAEIQTNPKVMAAYLGEETT